MYLFSRLLTEHGWTAIESLVFGSLISSTDPVTVLSLLPANVDKRLYMCIFGESALNDAVAIILYRFFTGLQADADNLGVLPFFISILASFGVFLGSFVVGVVCALVFAKITKHVWINGYEGAIYEIIMLFMFSYCSYLLAEILSLTGIISIFFCGITMAHYAHGNLTKLTQKSLKVVLKMVCLVFEGLIFLYLGLGLLSFGTVYDPMFIICAFVCLFNQAFDFSQQDTCFHCQLVFIFYSSINSNTNESAGSYVVFRPSRRCRFCSRRYISGPSRLQSRD